MLFRWLAMACLLIIQPCYASSSTPIKVLTEDLVPFQYYDDNKIITGYCVEVVQALLKEANLTQDIKITTWARAYNSALKEENVIVFSMVRTLDREPLFRWIGKMLTSRYYFFSANNKTPLVINTIKQAQSKRVGALKYSFEYNELKRLGFTKIVTHVDYFTLLRMLKAKRIDLLFGSPVPIKHIIKHSKYTNEDFVAVHEVDALQKELFITLSMASSHQLENRLKEAFERITKQGIVKALQKKWQIQP